MGRPGDITPGNGEDAKLIRRTRTAQDTPLGKRPFDVDQALVRIEEAVRPLPKASRFELSGEGFEEW